jgi:glycosyltransferase involved in cell wall biosynthesis
VIRSLHLINGLGTGGAERSLAEMLGGFVEHGIEPAVAAFHRRESGVEEQVLASEIPVHFVAATGWGQRVLAVRKLLRSVRPDVLHTTIFEADVVGRLAAVGTKIPVVTSLVNTSYTRVRSADEGVSTRRLALAQALDGATARHLGAGFHAITQAVADSSIQALGIEPGKVVVIPRGRSRDRLGYPSAGRRAAARERLGIGADEVLLLNVARREYQKGQSTLLEAAGVLRDLGRTVRVVIAGRDGSESKRLDQEVASLRLDEVVTMLGHVDDVPELLAAADVFVFPSRFEGLGGAVLEALALEVPVVASDVPALREVLRDGRLGRLVPVDDPQRLAEAIVSTLDEAEVRAAVVRAGREEFDREYGLDAVTARMASWLRAAAS